MSFLQAIPESAQLLLLGSGLFFIGILFRKLRQALAGFRAPLSTERHPEPKQS
jgi:hypothetical protein